MSIFYWKSTYTLIFIFDIDLRPLKYFEIWGKIRIRDLRLDKMRDVFLDRSEIYV